MSKKTEQAVNNTEEVSEAIVEETENEEPSFLDLDHPLNKEFIKLANGTFNHSRSVLNMVETIGTIIELKKKSIEILKLAAAFHDIGKMLNPQAFSENQKEDNIHDVIESWISYQLITRHVSDSIMILLNHGFPLDVIQIVSEHHGNSVLKVFFANAQEKDANIDPETYRYKTGKPSTIESMILMLCDVVESTSRSLYLQQGQNPDPKILITNLFNDLNFDGQFDNVEIKIGKIAEIQKALIEDTEARFHKREPYPDDNELMEQKDGHS